MPEYAISTVQTENERIAAITAAHNQAIRFSPDAYDEQFKKAFRAITEVVTGLGQDALSRPDT